MLSDGTEMKGQNKLDLVKWMHCDCADTGKGNYSGTIETSYKWFAATICILAKAKVTVVDKDGKKLKNVQFDGNAQTVSLKIK